MSRPIEEVVAEALRLPREIRALLAETLLLSLESEPEGELSPAWQRTIDARCRELDEGRASLRDADEVFAKAFAALKSR